MRIRLGEVGRNEREEERGREREIKERERESILEGEMEK